MSTEVKLLQGCQMMSSRNEISLGNGKKKLLLLDWKFCTLKIASSDEFKLGMQMEHCRRVGVRGTCRKQRRWRRLVRDIMCSNACTFAGFLPCLLLATILLGSLGMPLSIWSSNNFHSQPTPKSSVWEYQLSDAPILFWGSCSCTTSSTGRNSGTGDSGRASGTFFVSSNCNKIWWGKSPESHPCSKSHIPSSCSCTQSHSPSTCSYSCTTCNSPSSSSTHTRASPSSTSRLGFYSLFELLLLILLPSLSC